MKEMVYYPERLKEPEILFDETIGKFRIIGMNLGTHPTAYIGIPENHILAGLGMNDLNILDVHGGITFSSGGDDKYLPKGYWWYGWDYAHVGDWCGYYTEDSPFAKMNYRKWTTEEIYKEAEYVVRQFEWLEELLKAIACKEVNIKLFGGENE